MKSRARRHVHRPGEAGLHGSRWTRPCPGRRDSCRLPAATYRARRARTGAHRPRSRSRHKSTASRRRQHDLEAVFTRVSRCAQSACRPPLRRERRAALQLAARAAGLRLPELLARLRALHSHDGKIAPRLDRHCRPRDDRAGRWIQPRSFAARGGVDDQADSAVLRGNTRSNRPARRRPHAACTNTAPGPLAPAWRRRWPAVFAGNHARRLAARGRSPACARRRTCPPRAARGDAPRSASRNAAAFPTRRSPSSWHSAGGAPRTASALQRLGVLMRRTDTDDSRSPECWPVSRYRRIAISSFAPMPRARSVPRSGSRPGETPCAPRLIRGR